MDVTNPGLTSVADEVYGNPDPNGGSILLVPEQEDVLVPAANQGYPPPGNSVSSSVFPTPSSVRVDGTPFVAPVSSVPAPNAPTVIVDRQVIGQGIWVPVDPLDPAAGKRFVPPAEFVVVGPAQSFQTNLAEDTIVLCTITAVYDADNLWNAPGATTTRYLLVVAPPALTSYPVSILGREIIFADDTITVNDQGASRIVTGYSTNYVVIDKDDLTDQSVPTLDDPVPGDTFWLSIQRQGSEKIDRPEPTPIEVVILPPPPAFVPNPPQALVDVGSPNISTGPQPGTPFVGSGLPAPTAINVFVADQATSVGLPKNVNIP